MGSQANIHVRRVGHLSPYDVTGSTAIGAQIGSGPLERRRQRHNRLTKPNGNRVWDYLQLPLIRAYRSSKYSCSARNAHASTMKSAVR